MKRVSLLIALIGFAWMTAACSAPPRDESSELPEMEVTSISKRKVEDTAGTQYEITVGISLRYRGKAGTFIRESKGILRALSKDSKPVRAVSSTDWVTLDVACRDGNCNQVSVLVTAIPNMNAAPAATASGEIKDLPQAQLAVLFAEQDGELQASDSREGRGEIVSAASLF